MANVRRLPNSQSMRSLQRTSVVGILACCLLQTLAAPALGFPIFQTTKKDQASSARKQTYVDLTSTGSSNGSRDDGGTRGKCDLDQPSRTLHALVPPSGLGMTTSDRATAWFHIPLAGDDFHSMKIVMEDATAQEPVYEGPVKSSQKLPGIVGIELPDSVPSLSLGHKYTLRLYLYCSDPETTNAKHLRVEGNLERITEGISWQDALANQGRQQCAGTGNQAEWSKLLKLSGFKQLSSASVTCLSASAPR